MRIVFWGSGKFGIPSLKLLKQAGYPIALVVTTPAKPGGRGKKLTPTPIAITAEELNITILAPANPNDTEFISRFQQYLPQCGVLVDYGYILSESVLKIPEHGFINLHPSLLPLYRGAAPIPRQLMDGCTETGVTVFQINSAVDSGDILNQITVPVQPDETAGELSERLAKIGAQLLLKTVQQIESGTVNPQPQNQCFATRAPKITKNDRQINWQKPARDIHNQIRALSPLPGAFTTFRGRQIIVLRSKLINNATDAQPGSIITTLPKLVVATGDGLIELLLLKPAGGKVISGIDFRNGYHPSNQDLLGTSDE